MKRQAEALLKQPGTQERWIRSSEGKLHVVQAGRQDGPLVLFIHGSPGDWKAWSWFLADADLQAAATLVAVDRPGFGLSGPSGAVESLSRQAAAIAPLLEGRAGKTLLVGHSFGGPLALQLALDRPRDAGALLLLAGSIDPGLEQVDFIQKLGRARLLRWLVPRELDNCNFEILALKDDLLAQQPRLKDLKLPVRVIQGTKDDLVPAANADYAEAQLVNAKLGVRRLEGDDHFFLWRDPEIVTGEVLAILNSMKN